METNKHVSPVSHHATQPDEVDRAVAAERERCAKIADAAANHHKDAEQHYGDERDLGAWLCASGIADEIRNRGNVK